MKKRKTGITIFFLLVTIFAILGKKDVYAKDSYKHGSWNTPVKVGKYYYKLQKSEVEGYLSYLMRSKQKNTGYKDIDYMYEDITDYIINGKNIYYIKSKFVSEGNYKFYLYKRTIKNNPKRRIKGVKEKKITSLGSGFFSNSGKYLGKCKKNWIVDVETTEQSNKIYRLDVNKGKVRVLTKNFFLKDKCRNYLIGYGNVGADIGAQKLITINVSNGKRKTISKEIIAYFHKGKYIYYVEADNAFQYEAFNEGKIYIRRATVNGKKKTMKTINCKNSGYISSFTNKMIETMWYDSDGNEITRKFNY